MGLLVLFYVGRRLDYHEFSTARSTAETFERLNAILGESAPEFGFQGARVWETPVEALSYWALADFSERQLCRVDYFVCSRSRAPHLAVSGRDDYVLTVWGDVADMCSRHSIHVISTPASAIADWLEPRLFRGAVRAKRRVSPGNGVAPLADGYRDTAGLLPTFIQPS